MTQGMLDDQTVREKWLQAAPLIDRMMERVGTQGEFPVGTGSSLSGDDKASSPYQVSHGLRMCLTAGVDHLHAVKVLVVDKEVLHVGATSSLARGALENFAAAYWILGPDSRNDRIERHLRWYAKNCKDGSEGKGPFQPARHQVPGHQVGAAVRGRTHPRYSGQDDLQDLHQH